MSPGVLSILLTLKNKSSSTCMAEVTGSRRGGSQLSLWPILHVILAACCHLYLLPHCQILDCRYWKGGAWSIHHHLLCMNHHLNKQVINRWTLMSKSKQTKIHWSQKHYEMQIFWEGLGRTSAMHFIYVRSMSLCLGPPRQKIDSPALPRCIECVLYNPGEILIDVAPPVSDWTRNHSLGCIQYFLLQDGGENNLQVLHWKISLNYIPSMSSSQSCSLLIL